MNLQLRALREAHGLTPRQMYERLGVQDSRYRKWESETSQIPIDYAIMCCDILHCSLDELAGRKHVAMTADERELLGCYRSTDGRGREAILTIARSQSGMEGQTAASAVGD